MNSDGRSSARQPLRSDTAAQFSDEYVQPPFGCRRSRSILRSLLVSVWVIAFTIAASRGALVRGPSLECFCASNPEQAEQFTEHLTTSAGLHPGHPLLMLRNRLFGSLRSSPI